MAACVPSGVLLLVVLFGGSFSRPAKNVPHPAANPGSAGSVWEKTSPGFAASPLPYASASGSAPHPAGPQGFVKDFSYSQPAAPSYTSKASAPPAYSVYAGSSGLPISSSEVLAGPPGPPEMRPTTRRFDPENDGSEFAPEFGPILPPPGPFPPQLQAGELSNFEKVYEEGNTETETEEQGFQPPPPFIAAMSGPDSASELQPSGPSSSSLSFWPRYPVPYDYMFLTGQYPPGTYTHASQSFEHGADHWQDTHYIRDYFPVYSGPEQGEATAADFGVSQNVQQTSQPATKGSGGASYDQSGPPAGPNQAYGRPRWLASYNPTSMTHGYQRKPADDSRYLKKDGSSYGYGYWYY